MRSSALTRTGCCDPRSWADRAWVQWTQLVPSNETKHWIRVKRGIALAVWEDSGTYWIDVDHDRVGELDNAEDAKAFAVKRARELAASCLKEGEPSGGMRRHRPWDLASSIPAQHRQ